MSSAYDHANAPEVIPSEGLQVVENESENDQQSVILLPSHEPKHAYDQFENLSNNHGTTRICGLAPRTFWLCLLAIIVILAAGIGGGIGGGLSASRSSKKSSSPITESSPTATVTITSPSLSGSTSSPIANWQLNSGCNTSDGTIYQPKDVMNNNDAYTIAGIGVNFGIRCFKNLADRVSGYNPYISKLQSFVNVTSLDECLTLCAAYSVGVYAGQTGDNSTTDVAPDWSTMCSGVTYLLLKLEDNSTVPRCNLQNGTTSKAIHVNFGVGFEQEIDSAILQGW